jgi:hypothetical protein
VDQVMKDKNCMDPKMAVYCQAVRDLEDKSHGLEIHHVLCDYNKAVDVLAKTAYSHSPVPHESTPSDQHAPSERADGRSLPKRKNLKSWRSTSYPSRTLKIPTGGSQSSSG